MPKFIVERDVSGASTFSARKLHDISQKSIEATRLMGTKIQWVQSYVANDKIYCEYIAANEETIREHAQLGGFPVSRISRVEAVIDPVTAEWRTIWPQ
jgi:hypothetical protein